MQLVEGAQLLADLIASYEQSLDQQAVAQQGRGGGSSSDADFSGAASRLTAAPPCS